MNHGTHRFAFPEPRLKMNIYFFKTIKSRDGGANSFSEMECHVVIAGNTKLVVKQQKTREMKQINVGGTTANCY